MSIVMGDLLINLLIDIKWTGLVRTAETVWLSLEY
jgi:hypothetical protein